MSIIVVDDNREICSMIVEILTEEGYKVRSCTNPLIVFELINQSKPRLIVTDLLMSGIDGLEICKQLKADTATQSIKVLLMSALPNASTMSEKVGADAHIAKPFEIQEFAGLVGRLLEVN